MPTVRVECSGEYASTWIDYNARWTRAEVEQWDGAATEADVIASIAGKVTACHVETATGEFIDDPALLTWEHLVATVDEFILTWLAATPLYVIAERRILGKASPRVSSASKEAMRAAMMTMTKAPPQPTPQPTP